MCYLFIVNILEEFNFVKCLDHHLFSILNYDLMKKKNNCHFHVIYTYCTVFMAPGYRWSQSYIIDHICCYVQILGTAGAWFALVVYAVMVAFTKERFSW